MRPQIVKKIKISAPAVLCFLTSTMVLGQANSAGSGPPSPAKLRGPGLPIDDNLIVLLVLGLLYGGYVAYKKYRSKNTLA